MGYHDQNQTNPLVPDNAIKMTNLGNDERGMENIRLEKSRQKKKPNKQTNKNHSCLTHY